jgi:hypothetical protein
MLALCHGLAVQALLESYEFQCSVTDALREVRENIAVFESFVVLSRRAAEAYPRYPSAHYYRLLDRCPLRMS